MRICNGPVRNLIKARNLLHLYSKQFSSPNTSLELFSPIPVHKACFELPASDLERRTFESSSGTREGLLAQSHLPSYECCDHSMYSAGWNILGPATVSDVRLAHDLHLKDRALLARSEARKLAPVGADKCPFDVLDLYLVRMKGREKQDGQMQKPSAREARERSTTTCFSCV